MVRGEEILFNQSGKVPVYRFIYTNLIIEFVIGLSRITNLIKPKFSLNNQSSLNISANDECWWY